MSVVITARITNDEYNKLSPLIYKSGLTRSAFIKRLLLDNSSKIIINNNNELILAQKNTLTQINKIGNNLNQLTKLLNIKEKEKILTKDELLSALDTINNISNFLISKIR